MKNIQAFDFDTRIQQIENRLGALRERAKHSRQEASGSMDKQVRAFEDQYEVLRKEFDLKKAKSEKAYDTLTDSTKRAWNELWTGINEAYKTIH